MRVAVVTPTIGSETLGQCMDSVNEQTYDDLIHYVIIDGKENEKQVRNVSKHFGAVSHITLEDNIGKGWYGHRAYAACSFLIDADVIVYLDEDNWLEPTHIDDHIVTINEGYDWSYSLRNIHDKDGKYVAQDNCESLGQWPVYFSDNVHHIDTSCYAVKKQIAIAIGHTWYGQWGADRQFFQNLEKFFPNYACTGNYTLNYRLDGNPNSVNADFFIEGNKVMAERYENDKQFPWSN